MEKIDDGLLFNDVIVSFVKCGINPHRKEVYPQDLKRVRVSVIQIRKRGGKGR